MIDAIIKIFSGLTVILGALVLFSASQKKFDHKGMVLAGAAYLIGGSLGIYLMSFLPPVLGIILAFVLKKIFSEPDYSDQTNKSPFQIWWEHYKPLIGSNNEPMNYILLMKNITDMTPSEKDEYIKKKIESKLLWTVIDIGNGNLAVRPGKHEGNVVAWWVCDVSYDNNAREVKIPVEEQRQ
jgi:hypothetical protein